MPRIRLYKSKKRYKGKNTLKKMYNRYKKKNSLSKRVTAIESAEKQTATGITTYATMSAVSTNTRLVSPLLQGDDVGNRQGNRITVKSVNIRAIIGHSAEFKSVGNTYATPFNMARVIIFTWKKPQGQTFTMGDLLANITNGYKAVCSPYNVTKICNYKIWFDKVFGCDAVSFNGNPKSLPWHLNVSIKPPSKYATSVFVNNDGNAGSITENEMIFALVTAFVPGDVHVCGGTTVANTDQLALAEMVHWNIKFLG